VVALRSNPLPVTSYEIGMTAKELKPTAVALGPSLTTYHVCTESHPNPSEPNTKPVRPFAETQVSEYEGCDQSCSIMADFYTRERSR
jgi:hypothetical protein